MDNNEKYIARNLRNHREEIDMDDLWADISPHIPKEQKKRRVGLWTFGLMAFGLLITSLGWKVTSTENIDSAKYSDIQESRVKQIDSKTKSNNSHKNARIEYDHFTLNEQAIIEDPTILNFNNEQDETDNRNTSESNELTKVEAEFSYERNEVVINKNEKATTNTPNQIPVVVNLLKTKKSNYALDKKEDNNKKLLGERKVLLNPISKLSKIPFSLLKENGKITIDTRIILPQINKSSMTSNRWNIYLLGATGLANRHLSSRSVELDNERDRRNEIAEVLGAWEIEGGFGFRLTPKLTIMTGLSYTQIHEKANFESDYLVDYDVQSSSLIQRQDGSTENVNISSSAEGVRHTVELRYNQLRLFEIPVRLSYELLYINRFKINAGVSAFYRFKQEYSGFTSLSSSRESYDLKLDESNKFRSNGTLSYGLNLEGVTHITDMFDFSLGLSYKRIGKINSEIYLIDQQYSSFSFTGSVSRRF